MQPVLRIVAAAAFAALAAAWRRFRHARGERRRSPRPRLPDPGSIRTETNPANSIPIIKTNVTWKVTQTGTNVSGTVTTQSIDPATGHEFCNSCHRSRTGTLSGTISGTVLTWTATFPADPARDPTPSCGATLTGTISDITADSVSGTYSGKDDCEGDYTNGTLTMARPPAPGP
jgi:hypothetical protein